MATGAFSVTINGAAADLPVTAPGSTICTPITGLTAMQSLLLWLRLAYGSGGSAIKAYLQTALDADTWMDIACVAFATESKVAVLNFSALTPKLTQVTPTDGAIADNTALDGVLGDRVRLKVVVTVTYGGSTLLSGRIVAK
jgi:hypothetical protein